MANKYQRERLLGKINGKLLALRGGSQLKNGGGILKASIWLGDQFVGETLVYVKTQPHRLSQRCEHLLFQVVGEDAQEIVKRINDLFERRYKKSLE